MHIDDGGNKSASDLSIAYTIAKDISSFFFSTVGNIVVDVTNLLGISFNSNYGVASELWHTYRYGYKNVYVWSGGRARTPLNSQAVIWLMIVFSLVCLGGFLFYTPSLIWIILALIIPILRLSSWLLIERKIS